MNLTGSGSLSATVDCYNYSVKMIDQTRKSRYQVYKFRYTAKFKSLVDLNEKLKKSFPYNFLNSSDELGYIEPGHQWRKRSPALAKIRRRFG